MTLLRADNAVPDNSFLILEASAAVFQGFLAFLGLVLAGLPILPDCQELTPALALVRQVVGEFRAALDELHDDSTGISILGGNPRGGHRKGPSAPLWCPALTAPIAAWPVLFPPPEA